MKDLTASIVSYKNPATLLAQILHGILSDQGARLVPIDNSPKEEVKYLAYDPFISYIFDSKNIGFSRGRNISLRKIINGPNCHRQLMKVANVSTAGPFTRCH
jgi:hypothetical protein